MIMGPESEEEALTTPKPPLPGEVARRSCDGGVEFHQAQKFAAIGGITQTPPSNPSIPPKAVLLMQ